MPELIDDHARQHALSPNESFIVQAPAGSGKTELLIQRFLKLLAQVPEQPEQILAITFTRKAADEMRSRILQTLIAARDGHPCPQQGTHTRTLANAALAQSKRLAWALCENPHRLRIMTIDAVCSSIVTRSPILSALGGVPKVAEQPMLLYEQAALQTLCSSEDTRLRAASHYLLSQLDNRLEQVTQLLCQCLATREQWLSFILQGKQQQNWRALLETNLRHLIEQQLTSIYNALNAQAIDDACFDALRAAARHCMAMSDDHPIGILRTLTQLPQACCDQLPYWQGLAQVLLTTQNDFRKTVNVKQGFPAPSTMTDSEQKQQCKTRKAQIQAWLARLCAQPKIAAQLGLVRHLTHAAYTDREWEMIQALVTLLPHACAELLVLFRQQGTVDFTHITSSAIAALGQSESPSELALALDSQLEHILVDEFQDTSIQHAELILALTRGWLPSDGRTLFIVGDPMQSIYRFRQARVDLFIQAKRLGLGELTLTPLVLQANFRSAPAIVEWNNQRFAKAFPKTDDLNVGAVAYVQAAPQLPAHTNSCVQTHFYAQDTLAPEQCLVQLVRQCQHDTPDHSIAILVRSRAHLGHTLRLLRQHNMPYQATDLESLIEQPAIQDCLALTTALAYPNDTLAWLSVLRAPWCGLSLKDCYALVHHDKRALLSDNLLDFESIAILSANTQDRCRWLVARLACALKQRQHDNLATLTQETWHRLQGPATLKQANEIRLCEYYFTTLHHYLKEHAVFDKHAFTDRLKTHYCPEPVAASLAPCIHVMTLHKCKGLEFDTVIIPELARSTRTFARELLTWSERIDAQYHAHVTLAPSAHAQQTQNPLADFINQVNREKDRFEQIRLLYVGCTRAKYQLHLMAHLPASHTPPRGSLLTHLWPYLTEQEKRLREPAAFTKAQPTHEHATHAHLRRFNDAFYTRQPAEQTLPQIKQPLPTALAASTDAEVLGLFIHELCQYIGEQVGDFAITDHQHAQQQWRYRLLTDGLTPEYLPSALRAIESAIEHLCHAPRARWLFDSTHRAKQFEAAYSYDDNGTIKRVRLDYTFIDAANSRWIIDFKTTRPLATEAMQTFYDAQKKLHQPQLERYAALFRNSADTQPIHCGLYFPIDDRWVSWQANESPIGA